MMKTKKQIDDELKPVISTNEYSEKGAITPDLIKECFIFSLYGITKVTYFLI